MKLDVGERGAAPGGDAALQLAPELVEVGDQVGQEITGTERFLPLQEIAEIDDGFVVANHSHPSRIERGDAHCASLSLFGLRVPRE